MNNVAIRNGLQLSAYDIELLSIGKLIAVPFKQSLNPGQAFWLYPTSEIPFGLKLEQYYKPEYVNKAAEALNSCSNVPVYISTWGIVNYHWHIYPKDQNLIHRIAQSGVWNHNALKHIFETFDVLKLLFLQVHYLSKPCTVNALSEPGAFYWPSNQDISISAQETDISVVSKASFQKRKDLMTTGKIYPYSTLESLQLQLSEITGKQTEELSHDIKTLLGWTSTNLSKKLLPDWVNKIAALGERSVEEDEDKSNYRAGTDFENVVRQSLESLGFKIDYSHKGGAGGLDLFCSEPYSVVGECKSGKKIPNDTAVQLLNLGTMHLNTKGEFISALKIIIGPGEPTKQLQKAAKVHGMSIISPLVLEKLVKLHHQYPVDLLKLKDFLVDGQSDSEVETFIRFSIEEIKLRSHITKLVKKFIDSTSDENVDVSQLHAVYSFTKPPKALKREELNEILLELSSPLAGYLGRSKGSDGNYRFYYLRDLVIEDI